MNRREFGLQFGSALLAASAPRRTWAQQRVEQLPAPPASAIDFALRIAPMKLELKPGVVVDTIAYNGSVPGPVLRMKKNRAVAIGVENATDSEELVHWHGLAIDSTNDGAMEEGSPMIAPGAKYQYRFVPRPSGTRWYHTHTKAGTDFSKATYTGQFGFLIIDGEDAGAYDREVLLAIHHWEPTLRRMPGHPCEVTYRYASFNDKVLPAAEPIKVRRGDRVLFRFLNASATESVTLALPGHTFNVIALDGNPVPNRRRVETLSSLLLSASTQS